MFRKQVGPREVAIVVVLVLGIVQFVYWRLLVYREPLGPGGGGGGGPMPPPQPFAAGLEDVDVETLAGETPGFADGPSWAARFCGPNALTVTPSGELLVADSRNHRIRRVTAQGTVTTIAGGGEPGGAGGQAEGPALEARFRYPSGVAVTASGTLYISDTGNHRICRLRDGVVSVLAGGGGRGELDGRGAAARFDSPAALALAPDGFLWVLDAGSGKVRRVSPDGVVSTPPQAPGPIRTRLGAQAASGNVGAWTEAWRDPAVTSFPLRGRSAAEDRPGEPRVFADPEQNVLLVDRNGVPALIAGRLPATETDWTARDGDGGKAAFSQPCAVATGPDGTVYVAEYEGSRIRRLRLPEWLRSGPGTAPEPRGRWRGRRGN